jgi:hypothetical protein
MVGEGAMGILGEIDVEFSDVVPKAAAIRP